MSGLIEWRKVLYHNTESAQQSLQRTMGGTHRARTAVQAKAFSDSPAGSPTRPLTRAVDCNDMCYMFEPSEIAKFSRNFADSSLKKV
jgi:hypothetical protein